MSFCLVPPPSPSLPAPGRGPAACGLRRSLIAGRTRRPLDSPRSRPFEVTPGDPPPRPPARSPIPSRVNLSVSRSFRVCPRPGQAYKKVCLGPISSQAGKQVSSRQKMSRADRTGHAPRHNYPGTGDRVGAGRMWRYTIVRPEGLSPEDGLGADFLTTPCKAASAQLRGPCRDALSSLHSASQRLLAGIRGSLE